MLYRANQEVIEFVKMFKAPIAYIKVLYSPLTTMQEENCNGTEGIVVLPSNSIILTHSNEE